MRLPGLFRPSLLWQGIAVATLASLLIIAAGTWSRVGAPGRPVHLPLLGQRIAIDPGHGGIDPGCHRGGLLEKDITLAVALELAPLLEAQGATVFLTRTEDIELSHLTDQEPTRHRRDLRARTILAAQHEARVLLSLHVNSAGSSQMGGAMVFYHPSSDEGKRLAQSLLGPLSRVVPGNQNAALPANFFLLRHSPTTTVLVEMGFISNAQDLSLLTSPSGRRAIAEALAEGLAAHLTSLPSANPARSDTFTITGALPALSDEHACEAL